MVNYRRAPLDRVFASLADPTRREILKRLATGEKTISELAARFDMSLPAVSKHIRVLEGAGLARVRREGRSRHTALVAAPLRAAQDWIARYRRFWEFQFDQLAAYLAEDAPDRAHRDAEPPAPTDPQESTIWPPESKQKARPSRSAALSRRRRNASSRRGRGRKS